MNYFEHNAKNGKRVDVALDVVELDAVLVETGMVVEEHIHNTGEFRRLFAELIEGLK